MRISLFAILMIACSTGSVIADDWLRFRGPGGACMAGVALPEEWSVETGENVAWQVDTPGRGVSCPIVVDGRVILTCSSGLDRTRLHVVAYDSLTGKKIWHRQAWATGRTNCHDTSAVAANTPASDGARVFALYSSNDLICLGLDGNLLWARSLAEDHSGLGNDLGMASSPISAGGAVVVQCECQVSSFAAGYDVATGRLLWQVDRPARANWASPTAVEYGDGKIGVVLQSGSDLTLHDASNGEVVWTEPVECSTIPSVTYDGQRLYVPARGITVLDPAATPPEVVLQEGGLQPGSPSPVVGDGSLFLLNRAGVLSRSDALSGKGQWKARLRGQFWATPLLLNGKLVCINYKGKAFVVSAANGKVLSEPEFGEEISATPAAADGGMFVRSNSKLWKIAIQRQARK